MGKKLFNDILNLSPRKNNTQNNTRRQPNSVMNPQNNSMEPNQINIHPHSNEGKNKAKGEGQNGSGKTQDNIQVQNQRNQTIINGFDLPQEPMNPMNEDVSNNVQDESKQTGNTMSKKSSQYVKFYKFYYEKLKGQHPAWTPSQLTTIISLQWKKKKIIDKKGPAQSCNNTSRRSNKPLTGKQAFKLKHKDVPKQEIDQLWSKLPQESKNYWKKQGDSYGNSAKLSEVSSVKNSSFMPMMNTMRLLLNQV